jgi:protocatechuate 3,4-dioxygenase beta subunit
LRTALLLVCVARAALPQPTGSIEGAVTNSATHEPLAGVRVAVNGTGVQQAVSHRATTDAAGAYRVTGLAPGDYTVSAGADRFVSFVSAVMRVDAGAVRVNPQLMPAGSVRGRVLDEDGRPASGAPVELYRYRVGQPVKAIADGDGRFTFEIVPPGVYAVLARPLAVVREGTVQSPTWVPSFTDRGGAERVIVRAGAEVSGIGIKLRRVPVWRVEGVAMDDAGRPVAGAAVKLRPNDVWQPDEASATSDAEGVFRFAAVRPGEWRLSASRPGDREGYAPVTVEKHDVERVEIRMYAPFTLDGFIEREEPRDENGKRLVSGVSLQPVGGEGRQTLAFHEQDGTIHFKKVQPGRYVIFPVGYKAGYYVDSVTFGDRDAFGKPVDLMNGAIPFRVVYLGDAGRVRGTVEKCAANKVVLLPRDETMLDGQFIRSASCDAQGHFEVGSLKPGQYDAFAFDRVDYDALEDVEFVRALRAGSVQVQVEAGRAADIELKVTAWPE